MTQHENLINVLKQKQNITNVFSNNNIKFNAKGDSDLDIILLFFTELKDYETPMDKFVTIHKPYMYYLISHIKCMENLHSYKFYISFVESKGEKYLRYEIPCRSFGFKNFFSFNDNNILKNFNTCKTIYGFYRETTIFISAYKYLSNPNKELMESLEEVHEIIEEQFADIFAETAVQVLNWQINRDNKEIIIIFDL